MQKFEIAMDVDKVRQWNILNGPDTFLKFVRVDGKYRFCLSHHKHNELLDSDEKAASAGFLLTNCKDYLKVNSDRSITLNVGPQEIDEHELKKLFEIT